MKKPLLILIILAFNTILFSQITITSATLPSAGDTLKMSLVADFSDWIPDSGGEDLDWDFSAVVSTQDDDRYFHSPSDGTFGADFPEATFFVGNNGSEIYYETNTDGMHMLGFSTENPVTSEQVILTFEEGYTQAKTPMVYDEIWDDENSLYIGVNVDSIDEDVLDQIPFTFDTARLKITFTSEAHFDAWGDLTIPSGTFPILRENRTSMINFGVEIFFLGWQDVTAFLPENEFFENDTTHTYTFFNDESLEPIAEVTTTSNIDFQTLRFKRDLTLANNNISKGNPIFEASPNPAINDISFYYGGLEEGEYELSIINIIGSQLITEKIKVRNNSGVYYTDVSSLRQGTYFYSLKDEYGNTILTKRLIIIRP